MYLDFRLINILSQKSIYITKRCNVLKRFGTFLLGLQSRQDHYQQATGHSITSIHVVTETFVRKYAPGKITCEVDDLNDKRLDQKEFKLPLCEDLYLSKSHLS